MRQFPSRCAFLLVLVLVLVLGLGSCTLYSTATRWNGVVDEKGEPVFVQVSTNIGFNVLVFLPLLGSVTIDTMIDAATEAIAEEGGNRVRTFQTTNENYWYGFPPLTWILTPVITSVSMEYHPSAERLQEELAKQQRTPKLPDEEPDRDTMIPDPDRRRGQ